MTKGTLEALERKQILGTNRTHRCLPHLAGDVHRDLGGFDSPRARVPRLERSEGQRTTTFKAYKCGSVIRFAWN